MDCTVTTGRLLWEDAEQRTPYCECIGMSQGDPPIYTALVREWQASGRMLPGARDARGAVHACVAPAMTGRQRNLATVPSPGRWERAVELPSGRQPELVTTCGGRRTVMRLIV